LDVSRYLDRINYHSALDVSVETLFAVHRAHLCAIPFENLDIHLGRPILLEQDLLLTKIVDERRGGFCYELNGAFSWLLQSLGFEVELLSACVSGEGGEFGPPFDHMALIVKLDLRWLADVGFGDSFREPLLLDSREEQIQDEEAYRLIEDEGGLVLSRRAAESWKPQYRFSLRGYQLRDFEGMCRYHQTSPDSIFTRKRTCTIATARGRNTITGRRLIQTLGGMRQELELESAGQYAGALRRLFGVDLNMSDSARLFG
jgi:N-hydroxyarylamine O-acetyltransferase